MHTAKFLIVSHVGNPESWACVHTPILVSFLDVKVLVQVDSDHVTINMQGYSTYIRKAQAATSANDRKGTFLEDIERTLGDLIKVLLEDDMTNISTVTSIEFLL